MHILYTIWRWTRPISILIYANVLQTALFHHHHHLIGLYTRFVVPMARKAYKGPVVRRRIRVRLDPKALQGEKDQRAHKGLVVKRRIRVQRVILVRLAILVIRVQQARPVSEARLDGLAQKGTLEPVAQVRLGHRVVEDIQETRVSPALLVMLEI